MASDKPAADKPAADKPAAEKPAAEKPAAEKPAAEMHPFVRTEFSRLFRVDVPSMEPDFSEARQAQSAFAVPENNPVERSERPWSK